MIDPKELRVGNWVMKVTGIDRNSDTFFEYKQLAMDEYLFSSANVCFPIPLSENILGKAGFKHDFGDWFKNIDSEGIDDGLPFLRYKHKEKSWYLKGVVIPVQPTYLHQLQNLVFVLSNQELKLEMNQFDHLPLVLN